MTQRVDLSARRRSIRIELEGPAISQWYKARGAAHGEQRLADGVYIAGASGPDLDHLSVVVRVIDHQGDVDAPHAIITRALERVAIATAGEHGLSMRGLTHDCDQLRAEVIYA